MRVTCFIDSLISGGAQRQLCTLAVLLKRRGIDVSLLTYQPFDFFLPMIRQAGIGYRCLHHPSLARRALALRSALRRGDQDVVLAFQDNCSFYAELAALPARRWGLIVSERNAAPGSRRFKEQARRRLHTVADYVTTNSHTNRLLIERSVPGLVGRVATIYNALDLEAFSPGPPSPREDHRLHIVVAARYSHQKNVPAFVEAVALARAQAPHLDIAVDWYGYDPFSERPLPQPTPFQAASTLIARHGLENRFRLHPDSKDVIALYRRADAVALPSLFEGLPNTICEAMACGRPILMSNVCDAGNLVRDGQNGFLFDPGSPEDMARAILAMGKRRAAEREAMGVRARAMAEAMFNPSCFTDKYVELLEAAASRKRIAISHWVPEIPATAYQIAG
ncbi:MAG TPA: glycosyltransferase family 4 protein [Chthonomonadaceae bacterium]|nr:glycosyltransferase family 4 protein [Chthonomonadaceae bacterium]